MSFNIQNHYNYRKYADRVSYTLDQQRTSYFLPYVSTEFGIEGVAKQVQGMGTIEMKDAGPNYSDITFSDLEQPSRWILPGVLQEVDVPFNEVDRIKLGYEPSSTFLDALRMGLERSIDDKIIGSIGNVGGLIGTAVGGPQMATSTILPVSGTDSQLLTGASGFTWPLFTAGVELRNVRQTDSQGVEDWSLSLTSRQLRQISQSGPQFQAALSGGTQAATFRFGNADAEAIRLAMEGRVGQRIGGFNLLPPSVRPAQIASDNPLFPSGYGTAPAGYDYGIAFKRQAIWYGRWGGMPQFSVEYLPNKQGRTYVAKVMNMHGAVRVLETQVILFKTLNSAVV